MRRFGNCLPIAAASQAQLFGLSSDWSQLLAAKASHLFSKYMDVSLFIRRRHRIYFRNDALTLLQERGIGNVTLIVDGLEASLAGVALERWLFLLDGLGVRDPATIVQFRPLLGSERPYSAELATALLARGASAPDLVRCQNLLLAAGDARQEGSPVSRLAILMGTSYWLQLDEIA
jgi:hypothetical protein